MINCTVIRARSKGGARREGTKNICQNIQVEMSCCCQFSYVPGLNFFSAAKCLHATGLEGSQTWTMPHPDQQGWSHNGDHQLTLFVFISQRYSRFGVQFSHYLSFGVNTSLPCRDRSVMVLFSSKRTVQGRQSIQLDKRTFSKLTSYKSVKAILFVHISLERKEWISCNDVSCIM